MSVNDPYRELFELSADCILIVEGERFADCNPAAIEMFRAADISEMLAIHPSDISPEFQPNGQSSFDKANEMIRTAFAKGSHRFEWEHQRLDGERFPAEVLLTAIRNEGRTVLHSVVRDISDRKRLEAELSHAQKMEGVGKMAGGIAHDFNNLLVVILGSCDMLEEHPDRAEHDRYLRHIREAGERAAGLTRQLLTFSRKQDVKHQNLDLEKIVENLMGLLGRLVGEHIELDVTLSGPAGIYGNRHRVEQVVLNLISNAQDAMPDGGRLVIEVLPGAGADGAQVALRVTDDGQGMSGEVLQRAFEPFFTTKPLGAGTGLGLATVKNVVDQAGGEISITSSVGEGTTVEVRFPKVDPPREEAPEQPPSSTSEGEGHETILLVEDDSAIRRMASFLLSNAGFNVLTAENGEHGLLVAAEHRGSLDLIMTDVIMPRMGGPDMILKLRESGFETPVLFMSGYTDATLRKLDVLDEEIDLVEKPFNLQTLVSRVRAALNRG